MQPQVDSASYYDFEYVSKERFNSYWHQIFEISSLKPSNILEIGVGNGIVVDVIRKFGFNISTLDFDSSLNPTIVGSVSQIPCSDNQYDVISCCQVLEHLPYDHFSSALQELYRVSKKYVILSLPDLAKTFKIQVELPSLSIGFRILFSMQIWSKKWTFNGEHYWNINVAGYPLKKIIADIEKTGFRITKNYRVFEMTWHRFFILEK